MAGRYQAAVFGNDSTPLASTMPTVKLSWWRSMPATGGVIMMVPCWVVGAVR
jgi:hypothetical protein